MSKLTVQVETKRVLNLAARNRAENRPVSPDKSFPAYSNPFNKQVIDTVPLGKDCFITRKDHKTFSLTTPTQVFEIGDRISIGFSKNFLKWSMKKEMIFTNGTYLATVKTITPLGKLGIEFDYPIIDLKYINKDNERILSCHDSAKLGYRLYVSADASTEYYIRNLTFENLRNSYMNSSRGQTTTIQFDVETKGLAEQRELDTDTIKPFSLADAINEYESKYNPFSTLRKQFVWGIDPIGTKYSKTLTYYALQYGK